MGDVVSTSIYRVVSELVLVLMLVLVMLIVESSSIKHVRVQKCV